MKNTLMTITAGFIFLVSMNAYASVTLCCAPAGEINSEKSPEAMWPYTYSTLPKIVACGSQPALSGWGTAVTATDFYSADWTDGALACNYHGLTPQNQSDVLTLMSVPFNESMKCNFPTNGNKTFCTADDPAACPMVCEPMEPEFVSRIY